MEKVARISKKVLLSYRALPEKKAYLEFFTALLTIPVLITVIVLNVSNLKSQKDTKLPTPTLAVPEKVIVTVPVKNDSSTNSQIQSIPTATPAICKKQIGPIEITSPEENDTLTDNPVNVDIDYTVGEYCAVVWSYRVNGGSWSNYDDKSIALYNLPQGSIKLELRVKSLTSNDQKTLTRNFTYKGAAAPTGSQTNNSSASAN
jgi:hypothetical protein